MAATLSKLAGSRRKIFQPQKPQKAQKERSGQAGDLIFSLVLFVSFAALSFSLGEDPQLLVA
jgi:hypothetical protein